MFHTYVPVQGASFKVFWNIHVTYRRPSAREAKHFVLNLIILANTCALSTYSRNTMPWSVRVLWCRDKTPLSTKTRYICQSEGGCCSKCIAIYFHFNSFKKIKVSKTRTLSYIDPRVTLYQQELDSFSDLGPLLLTRFNFNPSMDK